MLFHAGHLCGQDIGNLIKQKPVTFHGSITNTLIFFNSGVPGVNPDLTWAISANATLSVYGFQLPFSFSYSATRVNYTQPFNQFGLSPKYKWITVHLGYRNLTFSNYTLAGVTFLGAGVELTPGLFRFGFIWGRFVKPSTSDVATSLFSIPELSRKGFAVKLGIGSAKNFVDLIVLKVKDDSTTLEKSINDSLTSPAANLVTALNLHFTLAKPLTFDMEGAVSLYTNDIRLTGFEKSSSDVWTKRLASIIPLNLSTEYYTAFKAVLMFKKPLYSFGLMYNRVDPDYKSMGIYYIDNDLENLTFNTSFSLFKRKISFSGSAGLQHDNLRGNKIATSIRDIWNASLSINPITWFGIDAMYSNFSTNQRAGKIPLVDSLKTYNVDRTLSVNPRFIIIKSKHIHTIILSYNENDYVDMNPLTSGATTIATTAFLNYTLTFIPKQLNLTVGLSYVNSHNSYATTTMTGGTAGLSKSFLKNKLFCSLNENAQSSEVNSQKGWVFNTSASLRYMPLRHHSFNLQLILVNTTFQDKVATNMYNQSKGDLSYVFTF
jgi:hypothetical protein